MCGASLTEMASHTDAESTKAEAGRRLGPKQIALLVGMALLILGGAVLLGLNLAQSAPPPSPTTTPTVTVARTSTPSPTATETPRPTHTPTPRPTDTPIPPEFYTVQGGDTLLSIAADFNLTVQELKAFNNLSGDNIVEGQTLQIPPPTPTPGPTPTLDPSQPTPTFAPFVLHTVKFGETLSEIAESYGVSIEDIRMANDMPPGSANIQANQVLEIPRYTPTPEVTPEQHIVQTGPPTPSAARYHAPTLLYPPPGTTFNGASAIVIIQWISAGILEEDEFYRVTLNVPTTEGPETKHAYVKSTAWRVPEEYFPPAEVENRRFNWSVAVVRQTEAEPHPAYVMLSQPSETREFFWKVE